MWGGVRIFGEHGGIRGGMEFGGLGGEGLDADLILGSGKPGCILFLIFLLVFLKPDRCQFLSI